MIVKYPDEILRQKCQQVKKVDKKLKEVVDKLKEELKESSNGVGLSAPQIGKSLRFFALQHPGHDHIHNYINPKILDTFNKEKVYPQVYTEEGDREEFYEGCLSFPGIYGTVKRWLEIQVKHQTLTENGKLESKEETLEGLIAIAFQHELDHLNGVLFIDHIKQNNGRIFKETETGLEEIGIEDVVAD